MRPIGSAGKIGALQGLGEPVKPHREQSLDIIATGP
jgi:hypothetical protein